MSELRWGERKGGTIERKSDIKPHFQVRLIFEWDWHFIRSGSPTSRLLKVERKNAQNSCETDRELSGSIVHVAVWVLGAMPADPILFQKLFSVQRPLANKDLHTKTIQAKNCRKIQTTFCLWVDSTMEILLILTISCWICAQVRQIVLTKNHDPSGLWKRKF